MAASVQRGTGEQEAGLLRFLGRRLAEPRSGDGIVL